MARRAVPDLAVRVMVDVSEVDLAEQYKAHASQAMAIQ
jgi:hypothetical protein